MLRSLLLVLITLPTLSAQEVIFRQVFDTKTDTHVEVTSLFSHPSLGGYLPVRVVIANNLRLPSKVYLSFEDGTNYNDEISTSSDYSFFTAPGKTVSQDILVPLSAQNGNAPYQNLKVSLSGSMGSSSGSLSSVFSPENPAVLLSEKLYTPNGSALDTERNSRGGGSGYGGGSNGFSSKFDPKRLPDDWRAFSGFDSLMLTESDWTAIPPGPRNAILAWLRLGGQLVIFTESNTSAKALGIPDDPGFGAVVIKPIFPDLRIDAKETVNLSIPKSPFKTRLNSITNDYKTAWQLQSDFGEKSFNYIFFIIILIAFGILVGPVNLFVFAKSGRRHRLFITTPLISIATSLLLVALIILQDGFGGKGSRVVLMEVRPDENQNAAFIHQEQFSRTGVMTSPAFSIDSSALIAPVPIAESRWARFTGDYDSRGTFDLQPADGKLYASGSWFQSRSEQGQLITAVVPTRGRIEATTAVDTLVSTFDFPIKTLFYKDASGNWLRAENITKGRPVKLTAVDPTMILPLLNSTADQFSARNKSFFNKTKDRPDHFIALTEAAPAIETHTGINWQKTTTVITGPIAR